MLTRKALPFLSAEVADELVESILIADEQERIESFAVLAIGLMESLQRDKENLRACDQLLVEKEINNLIGALFRRSDAYRYALDLYQNRHRLSDGISPADLLSELVDRHLEPQSAKPTKRRQPRRSGRSAR